MNLDEVTPADLARELGVEPKNVRDFLRREYGRLKERGETRWHLTPEQADAVRAHFRA